MIRNLTLGTEEYYNLEIDPLEKDDIKSSIKKEELINLRKKMNYFLWDKSDYSNRYLSKDEKKEIDDRLRALGYIE